MGTLCNCTHNATFLRLLAAIVLIPSSLNGSGTHPIDLISTGDIVPINHNASFYFFEMGIEIQTYDL